jgi:hypothetical protein
MCGFLNSQGMLSKDWIRVYDISYAFGIS